MKNKSFEILEKFYKSVIEGKNILNLPENRLSIYQNLVFNNIEDTCLKALPLSKKFLGTKWDYLMEDFVKNYKFETPYLWEVPKYFINFLENSGFLDKNYFLKDLMVYEWIEIEVFNENTLEKSLEFDWNNIYRVSESVRLIKFSYPVHKIQKIDIENIENFKGNYQLIIFQNPEDYEVEYIEITPFLFDILQNIEKDKVITVAKDISKTHQVKFDEIYEKLENFFKFLTENKVIC